MDNTSEKVCRVRTLVGPSGLPGANNSGLDNTDLINEIQYFIMQTISPDKSFLYNTNHLGENFYKQDSRWDALSDKPIRELTEEELKFGCTAVSTNGSFHKRLGCLQTRNRTTSTSQVGQQLIRVFKPRRDFQ